MKIKNLKINHKAVSKLTTCVLVGSFCATTLTGCTDRKSILDGTILENTCVVTFDNNSMDVAVSVESCRDRKYSHYYSVISGDYFVSEDCSASMINNTVVHHYSIINEENISGYLTYDDLTKAINGELDNNDIVSIIDRIINPVIEEEEEYIKTK